MRTAISVAVLGGALWAAFAIELGDKTFAEHVDGISETPEAKQLVDDTRATINPALVEVRDRVLGEYVEAPTWIPDQELPKQESARFSGRETSSGPTKSEPPRAIESAERPPKAAGSEPSLPGRRKPAKAAGGEPPLPGRR